MKRERIVSIVGQVMGVPAEKLTDAASPETLDAWDSLRHMNLMLALEEEFGIRLSDDQIMDMVSVGRIVEHVSELAPS